MAYLRFFYVILCIIPLLTSGCSGAKSLKIDASYTTRLGVATTRDFFNITVPILTRYNFLFEKSEDYGHIFYLETRWRAGPPLVDEAEIGVLESRVRLILRAKSREGIQRSNVPDRLNQVVLTAENEVRFDETEKWLKIPLSKMRKDYFKRIADELKFEYHSGLRVH